MPERHTLYAITHSLYSGRARSYLIKNGVAVQGAVYGARELQGGRAAQG